MAHLMSCKDVVSLMTDDDDWGNSDDDVWESDDELCLTHWIMPRKSFLWNLILPMSLSSLKSWELENQDTAVPPGTAGTIVPRV